MAIPQTDVIGPLVLPDGTAPFGARLKFELVKWDKDSGETILMGPVFADCDAAGDFTVSLWPSTEGVNSTSYAVSATYYNGGQDKVITEVLGFISVPEFGPVLLADLLTVTATPITTPEGLALMAAYIAAADAAAAASAASAAAALLDADRAEAAIASVSLEVNDFADLSFITSAQLAVGEFVLVRNIGCMYQRVITGAHFVYAEVSLIYVPHTGIHSILGFGAIADGRELVETDRTDNAAPINLALSVVGQLPCAILDFPGVFEVRSALSVTLGNIYDLALIGNGIIRARSTFDDGILEIVRTAKYTKVEMHGLSLLCTKSGSSTTGLRPFYFKYTSTIGITGGLPDPDYGYSNWRNFLATHCRFGGYDESNASLGAADNGVIIEYGRRPFLSNCFIKSRPYSDTNIYPTTYMTGHGLLFRDCYYGAVDNSFIEGRWGSNVKFVGNMNNLGAAHTDFEGCIVRNNELVGFSRYGVSVTHAARDEATLNLKEPGFFVQDNHIHAHERGVSMVEHAVGVISGNNIATTNPTQTAFPNESHVYLKDVHSVVVVNNLFWGPGYYNSLTDCTRGVVLDDDCNHVTIQGNHFMHEGIGILNLASANFDIEEGGNVWQGRDSTSKTSVIGPQVKVRNIVGGALRIGGWSETTATPSLFFGGAETGITYAAQTATVRRRGNEVFVEIDIDLTSKGTATGTATIRLSPALPLAANDNTGAITINQITSANILNEAIPNGYISGNFIYLRDSTTNLNTLLTDTAFGNGTHLRLTLQYFAEQD